MFSFSTLSVYAAEEIGERPINSQGQRRREVMILTKGFVEPASRL